MPRQTAVTAAATVAPVPAPATAAAIVTLEANTETKSVRNDNSFPYFVYGTATVVFENVFSGERFFNSNITNVKGADFNSQVIAGIRSYEKLSKKVVEQLESEILLVQSDNDK